MEFNKKLLVSHLSDLISSIDLLFKSKKNLPTLILLYSTIDILSWLNREKNHIDSLRSDFINWCNLFLEPERNFNCSGEDLYSARCGILHSYTAYSRMTRNGEAKQLWYSWGNIDFKKFEEIIKISKYSALAKPIQIEKLIQILNEGIISFANYIENKPDKEILVFKRAEQLFSEIKNEDFGL
jgi:hypothetical protein